MNVARGTQALTPADNLSAFATDNKSALNISGRCR
jgi:hypothetical protein